MWILYMCMFKGKQQMRKENAIIYELYFINEYLGTGITVNYKLLKEVINM